MSNKTQLQTNNTNLDALITRVNAAKNTAASLPSAGGSSGGGETCTLTIEADGPNEYYTGTLVYMNYAGEYVQLANFHGSIPIMKNSILVVSHLGSNIAYGNITKITDTSYVYIYYVTGDCYVYANS